MKILINKWTGISPAGHAFYLLAFISPSGVNFLPAGLHSPELFKTPLGSVMLGTLFTCWLKSFWGKLLACMPP